MNLSVIGTDSKGNPIDALPNPDTIKELEDFLTEMNHRTVDNNDVKKVKTTDRTVAKTIIRYILKEVIVFCLFLFFLREVDYE